jgi:raffinose synthase
MVDKFGWCTWDAFYSDVTPEGVLEGVSSLTKAGVQPKTVIIDDGWQTVSPVKTRVKAAGEAIEKRRRIDRVASSLLSIVSKGVSAYYDRYVKTNKYNSFPNRIWRRLSKTILKGELYKYFDSETDFARQLSGFEANDKFRLGALVSKLKRLGVTQVICWHALHGYWRGISPKLASSLNQTQAALPLDAKDHLPKHSHHLLRVEPVIAWDSVSLFGCGIVTEKDSLDAFFDGIHSILVDSGVDGVKVSQQSIRKGSTLESLSYI